MRLMICATSSGRSGVGCVTHAHKARHPGGIAHNVPGLFAKDHIDQDIARKDAALDRPAFTLFYLDLLFCRNDNIEDLILHPHGFNSLLQVVAHFVFVARIAMHHIPGTVIWGGFQLKFSLKQDIALLPLAEFLKGVGIALFRPR